MYTLGDIPRKGMALYRDRTAMIFRDRHVTYGELDDRVNRLANALIGLGLDRGDRITVLAENTFKYMELYFGAAKIGVSVTPLNFRLADSEIALIADDSRPSALFVGEGLEERCTRLKRTLRDIRYWVSMDRRIGGYLYYEEMLAASPNRDPLIEVDEDDLAILMYTGGTTGIPKGVMLSHRNIMTSAYGLIIAHRFTSIDIACFVLPMFHIALWPVLCHLMVGGKAVILPRAGTQEIMRSIEEHRCTFICLVPTLLTWLINDPGLDQFDLSSLRLINYSGSPIPAGTLRQCMDKFGNILMQGYGLTEAAPLVTALYQDEHVLSGPRARLLSSVGRVALPVEARVVDENDRVLGPDEEGEICVRGRNVMMGYWRKPELTARALRGGWLHTGDIGTMDKDGYIYLMDRKADMIITGGENVYPKETEDALYDHPAVKECAVISVPDDQWGERVQAVVVLKKGHVATAQELMSHCRRKLAGYKCPKAVAFWEELPKTSLGKMLRRVVKSRFCHT